MVWCYTQLVSSLSSLGDLSFSSSSKNDGYGLGPSLGSGLMKSKSDHRLAAQFRDQEDTYGYSGRTSPLMRRRFGERNVERYSLSHLLPILYPPKPTKHPTNTTAPPSQVMVPGDKDSVPPSAGHSCSADADIFEVKTFGITVVLLLIRSFFNHLNYEIKVSLLL